MINNSRHIDRKRQTLPRIGIGLLPFLLLASLVPSCSEQSTSEPQNNPPVVEIVSGPMGTIYEETAIFQWLGQDDGEIAIYYYDLNNPDPQIRTQRTEHTYTNLSNGQYTFYVKAEDNDGNFSDTAQRSFEVDVPHFVTPRGEEQTLEITTWNMENFPLQGQNTIGLVEKIIRDLDIDLFAVQEIGDVDAFNTLLSNLEDYDGLYSSDTYGTWYQKTGIIYKKSVISISSMKQLFPDENYAFPRPPIEIHIDALHNGKLFDFRLIVMHLKASGGSQSVDRRRKACQLLKQYLDLEIAMSEEKDYVVAGDWNDEIDDPPGENSFTIFLDVHNYEFLTWSLAGDSYKASYPRSGVLIDHILVSEDALEEYHAGSAETLRLDDEVGDYLNRVSDHRPVMVKFPVF